MHRGLCRTKDLHAVKQFMTEMEHADVEMNSISFNAISVLIRSWRVGSAAAMIEDLLNLGMKPSTKTCSLPAQSIGNKLVLEVMGDGSESSSDLLVCLHWPYYVNYTSILFLSQLQLVMHSCIMLYSTKG